MAASGPEIMTDISTTRMPVRGPLLKSVLKLVLLLLLVAMDDHVLDDVRAREVFVR